MIHKNDPHSSFTLSCVAPSGATTAKYILTRGFYTEASILKEVVQGRICNFIYGDFIATKNLPMLMLTQKGQRRCRLKRIEVSDRFL